MDFIGFLKLLFKRKWLILSLSFIAAFATYIITRRTSQVYVSKAQLATGITQTVMPSAKEGGVDPMEAAAEFSNLIEVMSSKQVLTLISYRLMLHDLSKQYPFNKTDELKKNYSPELIAQAKKIYQNKLDSVQILHTTDSNEKIYAEMIKDMGYDLKSLEKVLEVYRINNTDYLEVRSKTKNPWLSAYIVNSLCEEIIRYYGSINNKRLENSVKFFADLSAQKKKDLDAKLDSLNRFKNMKSVINFDEERKSKMSQISLLENSREEESKKILGLRQALATLNSKLSEGENENYDTQYTNNKVLNLKNRINTLQERYINSGNRDRRAYDSIEILKQELDAQVSKFGSNMTVGTSTTKQELTTKKTNTEIELEMAKSNLSSIENTLYGLKHNLTGFASNETSIAAMDMAISVAKDEYLNVLDKFNSAKNYSLSSNNLHQIEYAEPADEAEPSKVALLSAIAGISTLSLCIVILFTLEYLDTAVKKPSFFKNLAGIPVIGVVNQLRTAKLNFEELFTIVQKSNLLETHKQLIRKLRFEIDATNNKIFLFTSTKPNEGKSFVITSLAYSLALSGKKILLVDINLKNNSLTQLFNAKPGLNYFYVKSSDPKLNENQVINPSQVPGIDVVGSELNSFSPMELLNCQKFKDFLTQAKNSYDYIFMESACLNNFSDTKELLQFCEKLIAVFSAKSQMKSADKNSIAYFGSLGNKYLGSVLNKVDIENIDQ